MFTYSRKDWNITYWNHQQGTGGLHRVPILYIRSLFVHHFLQHDWIQIFCILPSRKEHKGMMRKLDGWLGNARGLKYHWIPCANLSNPPSFCSISFFFVWYFENLIITRSRKKRANWSIISYKVVLYDILVNYRSWTASFYQFNGR